MFTYNNSAVLKVCGMTDVYLHPSYFFIDNKFNAFNKRTHQYM